MTNEYKTFAKKFSISNWMILCRNQEFHSLVTRSKFDAADALAQEILTQRINEDMQMNKNNFSKCVEIDVSYQDFSFKAETFYNEEKLWDGAVIALEEVPTLFGKGSVIYIPKEMYAEHFQKVMEAYYKTEETFYPETDEERL